MISFTFMDFFNLQDSIVSVQGSPRLHFEPLKLLNFYFRADPDPAFHSNADSDPASQNNAYPCESGSANLICRHRNNEYGSVILQLLFIYYENNDRN